MLRVYFGMLKIQSLASGSRGNSILISSDTTKILVDIGLSLTSILKRLNDAEVDPATINAVFVTHEHSDHIYGVSKFIKKFGCKFYVHEEACNCFLEKIGAINPDNVEKFSDEIQVGDIIVNHFPVPHDSNFCYGYTFNVGDAKVSLATDLGVISDDVLYKMANSQVVLLECNHDTVKLHNNTKYPYWLKKRITSPTGHLSNIACSKAIEKLCSLGVGQIILAHLSAENNSPTLAYNVVCDFLKSKGLAPGKDICIDIALQDRVSNAYQIN